MVKRNPVPSTYKCSAADCVREARCHVADDRGVWYWFCMEHLDSAVQHRRTGYYNPSRNSNSYLETNPRGRGESSPSPRTMKPIIPREHCFSGEDFRRFTEDNPLFLTAMNPPLRVIANTLLGLIPSEGASKGGAGKSGRLEDNEENRRRARRLLVNFVHMVLSSDVLMFRDQKFKDETLKNLIDHPESVLNSDALYAVLSFAVLREDGGRKADSGGEASKGAVSVEPHQRIIANVDELVSTLQKHPGCLSELPALYRLFCEQIRHENVLGKPESASMNERPPVKRGRGRPRKMRV